MSNIVKFDIKQAPHAFDEVLELQIGSWAVPAGEITVEQYLKDCVAAVSDLKIADVNDKEGYEIVSRARKDLAKLRTTLEKTGKAARDNANAFAKAVIAEEKRLISIPSALEEEYKKMEKAYDDHWAEVERQRLQAEEEKYTGRIQDLVSVGMRQENDYIGFPEEGASLTLKTLRMMSDEEYQKFYESASAHWNDLEAARIAREKKEEEERQAELDRLAKIEEEAAAARESLRKTRRMVLDALPQAGVEYCLGKKGDTDLAELSDAEFEAWVQEIKSWEPTPTVGEIMEEVVEELRPEAEYPEQEEVLDAKDEKQAPYAINDLNDIDRSTPEGKLLFAAIAKITTESQQDKTPWDVIQQLNELSDQIESDY